jgi:tetratricopeptide (TPR) repeat protein
MGNFLVALEEVTLALKILPNAPSTLLVRGMLCSKLGRIDEANLAFQKATSQDPDQRDLCECLVAIFNHVYGHYDRAVQIASKILERCPNHMLALLIRADSYKFHNSGYFAQQAASDYSKLLALDANMQNLLGKGFSIQQHARVDELLLRFHPKLSSEGPRMLALYPMRAKQRPLFFVGLLFFVVGRLRTMVRSSRLLRSVFKQQEELQQKRAEAERKMEQLIEVQRQVSMLESNNEVWGPADPDHMLVKKISKIMA